MKKFKKLRFLYLDKEISQAEVARRVGMSESTLCDRMTGKQPFDAWQMDAIAQVLDIPREQYLDYFFPPAAQSNAKGRTTGGGCPLSPKH